MSADNIFLIADLHFGHDQEFVWKARGYSSPEEMGEDYVRIFNETVNDDSTIYLLGDVIMGESKDSVKYLQRLRGNKILIRGNHDTDARIKLFKELEIFDEILDAKHLRVGKRVYFLSHYPALIEGHRQMIGVHGHTHQEHPVGSLEHNMFCVSADAINGKPISIAEIREHMIRHARIRDSFEQFAETVKNL